MKPDNTRPPAAGAAGSTPRTWRFESYGDHEEWGDVFAADGTYLLACSEGVAKHIVAAVNAYTAPATGDGARKAAEVPEAERSDQEQALVLAGQWAAAFERNQVLANNEFIIADLRFIESVLARHCPAPGADTASIAFTKAIFAEYWPTCGDIDGATVQELGEKTGVLVKVKYDPKVHGEYGAEPGDDWFVLNPALKSTNPQPDSGGKP